MQIHRLGYYQVGVISLPSDGDRGRERGKEGEREGGMNNG
jgi:hypothetical protein